MNKACKKYRTHQKNQIYESWPQSKEVKTKINQMRSRRLPHVDEGANPSRGHYSSKHICTKHWHSISQALLDMKAQTDDNTITGVISTVHYHLQTGHPNKKKNKIKVFITLQIKCPECLRLRAHILLVNSCYTL